MQPQVLTESIFPAQSLTRYPCEAQTVTGLKKARLCLDTNASLRNAYFWKNNFDKADLSGADMTGIEFENVSFNGANLQNAILNDAKFVNCNLVGANMDGASLEGATFTDCKQ
jgi:uncharacterized protein YjbI with pentapeptide repeats